jgi:sodium/potassium/calcium exchanger 6
MRKPKTKTNGLFVVAVCVRNFFYSKKSRTKKFRDLVIERSEVRPCSEMKKSSSRFAVSVFMVCGIVAFRLLTNTQPGEEPAEMESASPGGRKLLMQWWGGDDDMVNADDDADDDDAKPGCTGQEIRAHKSVHWPHHSGGVTTEIRTPAKDSCEYVKNWCQGDATGWFAYMKFHYCNMSKVPVISFILLLLWLVLVISLLATTADNFFVPQLETLSDYLKLSPDVAGITLLAIGNGAPDVFAAKAALTGKDNDFPLMLSDLLGASVFISTVVLGSVCWVSNIKYGDDWQIDKVSFLRDCSVYIFAAAVILTTASDGEITSSEAMLFLIIYLVYIGIVVGMSVMNYGKEESDRGHLQPNKEAQMEEALLEEAGGDDDDEEKMVGVDWDPNAGIVEKVQYILEFPFSVLRWLSIPGADKQWSKRRRIMTALAFPGILTTILFDSPWNGVNGFNYIANLKTGPGQYTGSNGNGQHESSINYTAYIAHKNKDPSFAYAHPLGHPGGLVADGTSLTGIIWACGAACGIVFYLCTKDDELPKFYLIIVLGAFLSTIMWLDFIANELVAIVEAFGRMLNISTSILGLTVIAIGNSVGDLVAGTRSALSLHLSSLSLMPFSPCRYCDRSQHLPKNGGGFLFRLAAP